MNRLAWELRKRTVVAASRRGWRGLRDAEADGRLQGAIRASRDACARNQDAARGPRLGYEALGLRTNRDLGGFMYSRTPYPMAFVAESASEAGDYERALSYTEGIDEFLRARREGTGDGDQPELVEALCLQMEGQLRVSRAKALAGLRQPQDAGGELERAEALARHLAGMSPDRQFDPRGPGSPLRWTIAQVWEMLDRPEREAAILNGSPSEEERAQLIERDREFWRARARQGEDIPARYLEPVRLPQGWYSQDMAQGWAARMESALRRGDLTSGEAQEVAATALSHLSRRRLGDLPIADRCRAVAYEVLGDRNRALDGWQRYILSLMAMYEPDRSPLFDRAWAHVERLGGKRWS